MEVTGEITGQPPPSREEQDLAALAHALQIFFSFLGPLLIYILKRNSRFVTFHCLQAIFWQILLGVAALVSTVLAVGIVFLTVSSQAGGAAEASPALFLVVPIIWLFALGGTVMTLVLAIVYAIKAMRGEWAQYPLVGGWARRVAGL